MAKAATLLVYLLAYFLLLATSKDFAIAALLVYKPIFILKLD